ncbi:hypothetical protein ACLK1T_28365 [Escherichia coli]
MKRYFYAVAERRFGDNLQARLEQNARLPGNDCPQGKECEEKQ